jgi:hypothetical protein
MANTPAFTDAIRTQSTDSPVTADNVYTAPTAPPAIYTAGANGTVVEVIHFKAKGTNVATVARIFRLPGGTGSGYVLWDEVTLPATTAAAAAALAPVAIIPVTPLLEPLDTLHIALGTTVANGHAITVQGMDL